MADRPNGGPRGSSGGGTRRLGAAGNASSPRPSGPVPVKPAAGPPASPPRSSGSGIKSAPASGRPSGAVPVRPASASPAPPPPQSPQKPQSGIQKRPGTGVMRKETGPAVSAPPPPAKNSTGTGSPSSRIAKAPSSSRIARLRSSDSGISRTKGEGATDSAQKPNPEDDTSSLAFKLKFAMLAAIPVLIIIAVLLYMFGGDGQVKEDLVWKKITEDMNIAVKDYESALNEREPDVRDKRLREVTDKLVQIENDATAHYDKRRSETDKLEFIKPMEEFLIKLRKDLEWMKKWQEWATWAKKIEELFEEYKSAVSVKAPEMKIEALQKVYALYEDLKKSIVAYKDEMLNRFKIVGRLEVDDQIHTIEINLAQIEQAIDKAKKEIENAKKAAGGGGGGDSSGGGDTTKPERKPPSRRDPLKPEEQERVDDAARCVKKAKETYDEALNESNVGKRNDKLREATSLLVPAFKTYRDLWEAYKEKGEGFTYLEYEMDEIRTLDTEIRGKIRVH